MSKIKKKTSERSTTTISRRDINFEKAIQISGWMFLIAFAIFMGIWEIFDAILQTMEIPIGRMQFSYVVFTGTSTAFSFALSSKIAKNRDKKKEIFTSWLITEFLLCMFAIFSVAIYQW